MKYFRPKIEYDGTISIYDPEARETDYRRRATQEETIAALIYMVAELQNKLKGLSS